MASIKIANKNFMSQSGNDEPAITSNVTFPAGHILQVSHGAYSFTGDVGISTTSEVFGPVISMQMIKANANIFCILSLGELYVGAYVYSYIRLAYKTTSFTAAQGNTCLLYTSPSPRD